MSPSRDNTLGNNMEDRHSKAVAFFQSDRVVWGNASEAYVSSTNLRRAFMEYSGESVDTVAFKSLLRWLNEEKGLPIIFTEGPEHLCWHGKVAYARYFHGVDLVHGRGRTSAEGTDARVNNVRQRGDRASHSNVSSVLCVSVLVSSNVLWHWKHQLLSPQPHILAFIFSMWLNMRHSALAANLTSSLSTLSHPARRSSPHRMVSKQPSLCHPLLCLSHLLTPHHRTYLIACPLRPPPPHPDLTCNSALQHAT